MLPHRVNIWIPKGTCNQSKLLPSPPCRKLTSLKVTLATKHWPLMKQKMIIYSAWKYTLFKPTQCRFLVNAHGISSPVSEAAACEELQVSHLKTSQSVWTWAVFWKAISKTITVGFTISDTALFSLFCCIEINQGQLHLFWYQRLNLILPTLWPMQPKHHCDINKQVAYGKC